MVPKQKTLQKSVIFEGVGLHTGASSKIVLHAAEHDSGVRIVNARIPHLSIIMGKTVPESAMYATVVSHQGWKITTIEHVMAALGMLDIDNVIIELDGDEFPILDGSSRPFVEKILQVGLLEQAAQKYCITPTEELLFHDEVHGRSIQIIPAKGDRSLYVDYEASFDNPFLAGNSRLIGTISQDFFINELAPARTFGFLNQLPFMQKNGLAKGASLENTIVVGEQGFINELRFEDECLRHKVLDLLGDLSLLGKRLAGRVIAKKTGHNFNRLVIEHFITHPEKWKLL